MSLTGDAKSAQSENILSVLIGVKKENVVIKPKDVNEKKIVKLLYTFLCYMRSIISHLLLFVFPLKGSGRE